MKRLLTYFFVLVLVFSTTGCIFMPIINGFREMGATADSRRELLQKKIRAFNLAIKDSDMSLAMACIDRDDEEFRERVRNEIRKSKSKEKIVDAEIEYVEFDDDTYKADVEVRIKYYNVPFFVVNEKIEKTKWEFYSREWWLKSRESSFPDDE